MSRHIPCRFSLLLLLALLPPTLASAPLADRTDWDDVASAGIRLPLPALWARLQFPAFIDFLLRDEIASYSTSPSAARVVFPSGEWIHLHHVASDHLAYSTTVRVARMSAAALATGGEHAEVLLTFQAFPYAGEPGYSVVKTAFRIATAASHAQRAQVETVMKAFVRSCHDTARQAVGAFPCMEHYRSYGGTCNNLEKPAWGAYRSGLRRLDGGRLDPAFTRGTNDYAKALPNARTVSRKIFAQTRSNKSGRRVSMLAVFWGQFVDHDMGLTPESGHTVKEERMDIAIEDPADPMRARHGGKLGFTRSLGMLDGRACCGAGIAERAPRDQVNAVSGFIDASQVYGCDRKRVASLRAAAGEMLMTKGREGRDMLPKNRVDRLGVKLENAPSDADDMYVAGDVRANEQPVLAGLHTLFAREHNRVARKLRATLKCRSEERIFQYSRKIVSAQIQFITYSFFLPALLGKTHGLGEYSGYKANVDPSISNFFSGCAFRFGHSMVSDTLKILVRKGKGHSKDGILLHDTFFDPSFVEDVGIEPLLLGASHQVAEAVDTEIVNSLQNELFKRLTGGIDLVARNIQRGRDHGLPGYNDARQLHGLRRVTSFKEISSDASVQKKLQEVYKSVDDVDPFVGGLAEDHLEDSELGELFSRALRDQFTRLRDGDRFYYQNLKWSGDLAPLDEVKEIVEGRLRLENIMVRNSGSTLSKEDFLSNVFIGGSG